VRSYAPLIDLRQSGIDPLAPDVHARVAALEAERAR
jgi:hypothetical protein